MKFLIKSKDKCVWWRSEENGYTTLISEAGIYSEEFKNSNQGIEIAKNNDFIPLTYKLVNQGRKEVDQLLKIKKENISKLLNLIAEEKKNMKKEMKKYNSLYDMEKEVLL